MHAHRRTARALGLGALALALPLTGCVSSDRAESATGAEETECPWEPDTSVTTSATLGWQASPTGDLVVKDMRLLESCMPNAEITWSQFASGGDVVQAFGAGSVDLGMLGSSPSTIALSKPLELPIKVVWIQEVIGEAEALVAKEGIEDLEDLKGKRVAVPFSSTAHFSLLQALDGAGLQPGRDLELINLAPEAMAAAWGGDEIDAVWVWNPVLGQLLAEGGVQVHSSKDTAEAGKPTYDLSAATTEFADANPEFMTQWAKAQDYAVQLISDDPAAASEAIAIQMGVSPNEVSDLFAGYIYLPASEQATADWLDGKVAKDLQTTAEFLLEQGSIEGVSPADSYSQGVDPGPAQSVG